MSGTAAIAAGVEHEPGYTYRAFISYRHADERSARWLHRSLETYTVPRSIAGTPGPDGRTVRPARLFRLLRDREEPPSASSLDKAGSGRRECVPEEVRYTVGAQMS